MKKNKFCAAIYVRAANGCSENQIEKQTRTCADFIARCEVLILKGQYADLGLSGHSSEDNSSFETMLRSVEDGEFSIVISTNFSRFGRNPKIAFERIDLLKEKGVAVYFVEDDFCTMGEAGELRLSIMKTLFECNF